MSVFSEWWDSKSDKEKNHIIRTGCAIGSALALGTAGFIFGRKYEHEHILDRGHSMTLRYGWNDKKQKLYVHPEILDRKDNLVFDCGYGYYAPAQVHNMIIDMHATTVWPNGSTLDMVLGSDANPITPEETEEA